MKESLAIINAKSLFDHLSCETIDGQDGRTAIEIQIIREDLNAVGGKIYWLDYPAMIADPLIKTKGAKEALFKLLETKLFAIKAEENHIHNRKQAKELGQNTSQLRREGVKVNRKFGCYKSSKQLIGNIALDSPPS